MTCCRNRYRYLFNVKAWGKVEPFSNTVIVIIVVKPFFFLHKSHVFVF